MNPYASYNPAAERAGRVVGLATTGVWMGILAFGPSHLRRWMISTFALGCAVLLTVKSPHDYVQDYSGEADYQAYQDWINAWPAGYHFPWYSLVLLAAFVFWLIFGYIRVIRMSRRLAAVGQMPLQRLRRAVSGRVIIGVDTTQRPPQSPTEPSPPTTVPFSPYEPPMGASTTPTLYIPTYVGAAKPLRREITMGGTIMKDARGVDPDTL